MVLGEKHGTNYLPCTFALSQKRKCQIGLHQNFLMEYPKEKILEISSSSLVRDAVSGRICASKA